MRIECDDDHIYRVDGDIKPGVSEILKAGGYGDPSLTAGGFVIGEDVIEAAGEKGHLIHEGVSLLVAGILDWESIEDEDILEGVTAFEEWKVDSGFEPLDSEKLFFEPTLGYCGTRDLKGLIGGRLTIVDVKTGSAGLKPWHRYQLAAYAYPESNCGENWPDRLIVHLRPELKRKRYREHYFSPKSAEWDFEVFTACKTLLTAKELEKKC